MTETPAERTARLALDLGAVRRQLKEALAEKEELDEEYAGILQRQGELLTGVANALKGSPPELTTWSHHDLPELAAATAARTWQEGYAAGERMAKHWGHVDYWEDEPENPYVVRRAEPDPDISEDMPLASALAEEEGVLE